MTRELGTARRARGGEPFGHSRLRGGGQTTPGDEQQRARGPAASYCCVRDNGGGAVRQTAGRGEQTGVAGGELRATARREEEEATKLWRREEKYNAQPGPLT
ncbi:hypothetical protein NL676_003746 [Syzygium grande]|nr:hypothetical protein NL676_003746 [Syzygium grande]